MMMSDKPYSQIEIEIHQRFTLELTKERIWYSLHAIGNSRAALAMTLISEENSFCFAHGFQKRHSQVIPCIALQ